MGFTGKEAARFKEDYIAAFNEMRDMINSQNLTLIAQFNKAFLEFERASDIASQTGRNLSSYGRKIKPLSSGKKLLSLSAKFNRYYFRRMWHEQAI